jgi:uncharacterized membrane protein
MRLWILHHWDSLRTNYWFMPALMAAAAVALAAATTRFDRLAETEAGDVLGWAYTGGPEGARAVLSTIAGSMITVAGTVFSITIVALTLASGQFGPRLLRNYIRDRGNQFVLGVFTATFLYCLLILRTVRGGEDHPFVPGVSVSVALALALLGLGVLIYFIHHVAVSIQASQVIAVVNQELLETIDRLWPTQLGEEPETSAEQARQIAAAKTAESQPVAASASGYIDAVNGDALLGIARERNLVIALARRPGHFIVKGSVLANVSPVDAVDKQLEREINSMLTLSSHRTPFQDVEFAVDQLVEIAVRALSPGINDPFTAMSCLDRLGEALCRLAHRSVPSPYRYDDEQRLRVIARPAEFSGVVDAAFNQIRQYGSSSAAVLIRMLETLAVVANHSDREEVRSCLARHARLVQRAARSAIPDESDRMDVEEQYAAVQAALKNPESAEEGEDEKE